jgi:hypothetical protein
MKGRFLTSSVAAAALAAAFVTTPHAEFRSAMNSAMAPYYAALIASLRGDAESTQRDLVVFAARWGQVSREEPPAAIQSDPQWSSVLARVAQIIKKSEQLVHARKLTSAHTELEGVRLVLREIRGRHNLLVFDDWLTDYHESMERIAARAAMQNEIVLADSDFVELAKDLTRAKTLWATVEREAGPVASAQGWAPAARRIATAHADLDHLLAKKDPAAIARAATELKNAYHDLLAALSRAARE